MPNLFHKYQQPIWIALTIGVIASFILFWNGSMMSHGVLGGAQKLGSIYGQTITDTGYVQEEHKFQIALALGMNLLVEPLAGNAQTQGEAEQNFVINSYVLDHEVAALQIRATDAEMQDALSKVTGFQTDGRFDPAKLTDFVQNKLPSLGFTDAVIDELVRKEVEVEKVATLIGSTVDLSAAELKNQYIAENEKMDLSVIRLDTSEVEKGIVVTDADAQKEYDSHKEGYQSEELRKVSVASFEMTEAQKQLKGKDRTDVLQKLGDEAYPFSVAVVDKNANFGAEAQKAGVPVKESALFTTDLPDPGLSNVPGLATAAFKLSSDYPSSDVIEGPNGYYVLHLAQDVPARQLAFAEAKPVVIAQLQKERAAQLMQTKANEMRNTILAGLTAGKSLVEAAKEAGATVQTVPPFSLSTVSSVDVPDLQSILQTAVGLGDKQLSDFVETAAGGLLVYMSGREPLGNILEMAMGEASLQDRLEAQKRDDAFLEWLRLRRQAARLQVFQRGA
jgi:hypothetical protein